MEHAASHHPYRQLAITLIISFVIMYMVMFLNMASISHFKNSITRMYMALLMIAPMAVLMLLRMPAMYKSKKNNATIIAASVIVFALTLMALRTQTPIGDVQYMKAMIRHHSSAILTSKNATLTDPEVKRLSEEIISAQQEEIAQMQALIDRLKSK